MFNIKRRKHLYTTALRHSHIQLYKTEKGDSLGKTVDFRGYISDAGLVCVCVRVCVGGGGGCSNSHAKYGNAKIILGG